jgi:hypothetical protein
MSAGLVKPDQKATGEAAAKPWQKKAAGGEAAGPAKPWAKKGAPAKAAAAKPSVAVRKETDAAVIDLLRPQGETPAAPAEVLEVKAVEVKSAVKKRSGQDFVSPLFERHRSMDLTDSVFKAERATTGDKATLHHQPSFSLEAEIHPQTAPVSASRDPLAQAKAAASEQNALPDRNYQLLSRLLDLENPQITDRMVDFLCQDGTAAQAVLLSLSPLRCEGVMDALMSFISGISSFRLSKLLQSELHASHARFGSVELASTMGRLELGNLASIAGRLRSTYLSDDTQVLTTQPSPDKAQRKKPHAKPHAGSMSLKDLDLGDDPRRSRSPMAQRSANKLPIPEGKLSAVDDIATSPGGGTLVERLGSNPSTTLSAEDAVALQRSHRAMSLICEQNDALLKIISKQIFTITLHVLAAFHPTSLANLYHVCKVFSQIVRWFPSEVRALTGAQFFTRRGTLTLTLVLAHRCSRRSSRLRAACCSSACSKTSTSLPWATLCSTLCAPLSTTSRRRCFSSAYCWRSTRSST